MHQGADGLFLKNDSPEKLSEAILTITQGKPWFSPELWPILFSRRTDKPGWDLSEEDLTILRLVADDKTNSEIACALHICQRKVGKHISSIFLSLNVKTRAGAVSKALRLQLIE